MDGNVRAQLATVAALPDQKAKLEQYKALLNSILSSQSVEACNTFVDHMLSDDVPLVVSRQLLQMFVQDITKLPADSFKAVATHALEKIQPRVVSFEEQVTLIREALAQQLEKEEEWSKAAQTLAGIDLDSGMRQLDNAYRLSKNIKITMLYLEDDDPVSAEQYIKKASALISASTDEVLDLQFKTCYARIMDAKRRFLDAATRYYELSSLGQRSIGGHAIDEEELETALKAAITCTILAAAGPQRSRMLSTLYKDERSAALPEYPFLKKVYLERILRREEVEAFSETLKPHQKAKTPDGTTVLERAVMQHNLLSASKLYNNITIQELGTLLGVEPVKAEQTAADMISEGRLQGSIDQVESLIFFDDAVEPLMQWDRQIQSVCNKVNDIIDAMGAHGIAVAG